MSQPSTTGNSEEPNNRQANENTAAYLIERDGVMATWKNITKGSNDQGTSGEEK